MDTSCSNCRHCIIWEECPSISLCTVHKRISPVTGQVESRDNLCVDERKADNLTVFVDYLASFVTGEDAPCGQDGRYFTPKE